MTWARKTLSITWKGVKLYCCAFIITEHFIEPVYCEGSSMLPTVRSGDLLLADRFSVSLRKHEVTREEMVICKSPKDPDQFICKRLIHREHDWVLSDGEYFQVPKGHVWLEGDNAPDSEDSRSYGPVPAGLIRGRVLCAVWPLDRARMLSKEGFIPKEQSD